LSLGNQSCDGTAVSYLKASHAALRNAMVGMRTITLHCNMQNSWLGYNFVLIIATLQQIRETA
jgi:hypothetical protein